MKQEDVDLLLKDLCGRLPYGVKVLYENKVFSVDYISAMYEEIKLDIPDNYTLDISEVKPYLLPLSSMTEEQKRELEDMGWSFDDSVINNIVEYLGKHRQFVTHFDCFALIDWLNAHHLDYRGLIDKGLAIDCTNLNIY